MRLWSILGPAVGLALASATVVWALNIRVTLPRRAKPKIVAIVDEDGNVLSGVPGPSTSGSILAPTKASEVVALQGLPTGPEAQCQGFAGSLALNLRRLPDGDAEGFTIPDGQVLVVTDFSWRAVGAPASQLATATLAITIGVGINGVVSSGALADSTGKAFGHEIIPHGVVVKSGHLPCIVSAEFPAPFALDVAEMNGFLAPDE